MSAMTHDAEWLLHLELLRNEQIQDKERRRGRPGPVGGKLRPVPPVLEVTAEEQAAASRQMARISLSEVAAAIGVDKKTVGNWENGTRTCTSPYALAYADALNAMARFADPNHATRRTPR